jgi:D-3-phosphoglycerate dehydrogenase
MKVIAYDPKATVSDDLDEVVIAEWPERLVEADFIVVTCSLTDASHHMLNKQTLALAKDGVMVVNVSRGGIIDELSLVEALDSGKVYSAAMDVFEVEPLPSDAVIRNHPRCIFGAHNASNTIDAVERTSRLAIDKLFNFLEVKP